MLRFGTQDDGRHRLLPRSCYGTISLQLYDLVTHLAFPFPSVTRFSDGLIYFLLITGARVANLFLFIEGSVSHMHTFPMSISACKLLYSNHLTTISPPQDAVVFAALFGFFPIGGTLISRLTLNLRASGKEGFATRDDQTWAGQRPQYGAPAQVFGSTAPPRSTVAFPVPMRSPISEAYELRTLQTSHDVSVSSLPDSSSLDVKNGAYV